MSVRVILAKDASAADALRTLIGAMPEDANVWLADRPSPYGTSEPPLFAGVAAFARATAPDVPDGIAYEAEEIVAKPGAREGIGLLALLKPLPGLSRNEVFRHWDEHIPLANEIHHKATSYRQFRFSRALTDGAPDYAGFALLHFPDAEVLRTGLYRNEADMKIISDDVAEFATGADVMFVTEYKRT